jgi:hypothetical protein
VKSALIIVAIVVTVLVYLLNRVDLPAPEQHTARHAVVISPKPPAPAPSAPVVQNPKALGSIVDAEAPDGSLDARWKSQQSSAGQKP